MPANNRMSVSDSLRTTEIWKKSVGYDPYAPEGGVAQADAPRDEDKAKSLFALARATGASGRNTPGACKKCGHVGHLTKQCRNDFQLNPESQEKQTALVEESEDEEEETLGASLSSSSSDSSSDSDSDSDSSSDEERRRKEKRKKESKKVRKDSSKKKKKKKHGKSSKRDDDRKKKKKKSRKSR
uniref:CCHC-type domain-containing protein n=1 Tax=Chromera velia CCMP2878 TaxID=1169474 RepID=A0A0G4F5H0_9ALVE|eukprot:Cvel_15196.t1-p1 / transcript=Cvel_15196.t1 / gene=Cvel_15196 / organism=Chromera_velia_CCMP2878 / gene_product=CAX-interacting protein 4, putative / transcript_product=CAX-interacting protein 4, putative / location=Cvel_scaffold1111:8506-11643(-) / protein_length=183 / sequence_SO=supercontig / SO=protein_coding / is_pseudo=false